MEKKFQEETLVFIRKAIRTYITSGQIVELPDHAPYNEMGASFVSLHIKSNHELRGCIGSLQAHRALGKDLIHNALSAAMKDPRFTPLTISELDDIELEVSLLSDPKPFIYETVEDLLTLLRPHEDGVIIEYEGKSATFLPSVWEQVPDPAQFLAHLCLKAGFEANFFLSCKLNVRLYSCEIFSE